jgi:hypothetical protein
MESGMTILPRRPSQLLAFLESHLPVWGQDPGALGLSAQQLEQIQQAAAAARSAMDAAVAARSAALAATGTMRAALRTAHDLASVGIAGIKAHAARQEDPQAVYSAAQIPAPAAPSPIPAPGGPFVADARIDGAGALHLSWKARHPRGTRGVVYLVRRRLRDAQGKALGGWQLLGTTGKKTYIDRTLPAGTAIAEYSVESQRGEKRSGWGQIRAVQFGGAQAAPVGGTVMAAAPRAAA